MATRPVKRLVRSKPTMEGAGVRLRRAFGFGHPLAARLVQPLGERVAWYGPIVMNTQEDLQHAFEQLDAGTFLRPDAKR